MLIVLVALAIGAGGWWLSQKANQIRTDLEAAQSLGVKFKGELLSQDAASATITLNEMASRTSSARVAAEDPLWKLAGALPGLGPNFTAISEVAFSADDVVKGTARPLLGVIKNFDVETLKPINGKLDLAPIEGSSPSIISAAHSLELSRARLRALDPDNLIPPVSIALKEVTKELGELHEDLGPAANMSRLLPSMMGSDGPRNYLVLVQNNSEVRATGGLPGALAVLTAHDGKIELTEQSSGSAMGRFNPPVPVDPDQVEIYTSRLGAYISDVNLTPDFPTAAKSAKSMWEARKGTHIDGVIALDPVVLSHLLEAIGPVRIPESSLVQHRSGLPTELTDKNVVQTLLSDVYSAFESNTSQDEYFARITQEVFAGLTSGQPKSKALIGALTKSTDENRVLLWSSRSDEQTILEKTSLAGSTTGPSVGGAAFGAYFNDGTGAKMDFHVKRNVQLVKECPQGGYDVIKVRVTMSNNAPLDAAATLPKSVTGGGLYGIPPGTVQTNIIAYGPAQAHIETAQQDGTKTPFASHFDRGRPVGVLAARLQPGQSTTVEFTFGKIVQSEEPTLVMTPSVQPKDDVVSSIVENCS